MSQGWTQTYPELKSRTKLLAEFEVNPALRHAYFKALNALGNVVLMQDEAVRHLLFDLVVKWANSRFQELRPGIKGEDYLVWNELVGSFRNITWNMTAGLYRRKVIALVGPYNVYIDRPGGKINWHWLTDKDTYTDTPPSTGQQHNRSS